MRRRVAAAAIGLTGLCLILFVPGIASLPPVDRDEARYAQATRQMLESGDFVDVRFQAEARHKKPIGIYWLQAATVTAIGEKDGAAMWPFRVPSLAGAIAAVLLTAWIGASLFSPKAGLLAGVLLASSLLLNVEARLAKTDAALLACVAAAQLVLARAHRCETAPPERWALLFWGALGAGILVKGPIVPIVVAGTLLFLIVAERRSTWLRPLRSRNGVALMLVITAPWLIAIAYRTGGAFFAESIVHDLLGKVMIGQERHGAPPGYHLLAFAAAFWPFSLLAALAVPWVWRNRARPPVLFCIAWIAPTWILFELAATKLPHYVLPVYPAIAILTGAALVEGGTVRALEQRPRLAGLLLWTWLGVSGALALGVAVVPIALDGRPSWIGAAPAAAVGLLVWAARSRLRAGRHLAAVPILAGAAVAFHALLFGVVLPDTDSLWPSRSAAALVGRVRSCPDATVAAVGYHEPSLVFLLGTGTKLVGTPLAAEHLLADPGCALALVPMNEEAALQAELARSEAEAARAGEVTGIDYSNGRRVELGLYRIGE